jgi:hypothetical protein
LYFSHINARVLSVPSNKHKYSTLLFVSAMPGLTSPIFTTTHSKPSELPTAVWQAFEEHQRDSNIMYPHAMESLAAEKRGEQVADEFWICVWTCRPGSTDTLDFVLACTKGHIDSYPIFIFSTVPALELTEEYVSSRMDVLTSTLLAVAPVKRVFSVFAPRAVTTLFADYWTERAHVELEADPEYYAATFAYCSRATFKPRSLTVDTQLNFKLRRAVDADVESVAELCFLFAKDSVCQLLPIIRWQCS